MTADPHTVLARAARAHQRTRRNLLTALAEAYGTVPVATIAKQLGVSRPTVYQWLREAGVEPPRR